MFASQMAQLGFSVIGAPLFASSVSGRKTRCLSAICVNQRHYQVVWSEAWKSWSNPSSAGQISTAKKPCLFK